jgi:ABC-type nitrate/sulfonate/bicarbonate transport system substrate-binding protein
MFPPKLMSVAILLTLISGCASAPTKPGSAPPNDTTPQGTVETIEGLCGPVNPNAELTTLSVGNSIGGLTEAYLAWGEKEGCFAKYGLSIDSIPAGGAEKIPALVGGSMHVAAESAMTLALTRGNSDIDLRILSGHYEVTQELIDCARANPGLEDGKLILEAALIVSPNWSFEKLEDLRGAKISVSTDINPPRMGLIRALREVGVMETEVELVPLGSSAGLDALLAGEVDAAILAGIRAYQAMDADGRFALYPGAYFYQPTTITGWLTTGEIVEQRGEDLQSFKKAMMEIYELLKSPAAQESFFELLRSEFGFDDSAINQFSLPPLMTREVTAEEFRYLSDELLAEGLIDREVDFSKALVQ